ncbi:MAG: ArsR/SmtB family transcription factor [Candidatus Limnocylindrales bacterium]
MEPTLATTMIRLDARALRILAHPLRSRLLTALRFDGPATATSLARSLDTNTGATSYHLRRLAAAGLVEEAEGGHGRERLWRASTESHSWTEGDLAGDPDGQAASDWLRRQYLGSFVDGYERWLEVQKDWPIEWRAAAESIDAAVRVTPDDLTALLGELTALFERYRDPRPDDPVAERVQLFVHTVPVAALRR